MTIDINFFLRITWTIWIICVPILAGCNSSSTETKTRTLPVDKPKTTPIEYTPQDLILLKENVIGKGINLKFDKNIGIFRTSDGFKIGVKYEGDPISYNPDSKLFFVLSPELARDLSGKNIEIEIEARSASNSQMRAIYSTLKMGNSGLRTFNLNDKFSTHSFEYKVPVDSDQVNNRDALSITSDGSGAINQIEVKTVYLSIKP